MSSDTTEKKVITRAEAKALGLSRYFTGKPCKHGHIAERRTLSSACVICDTERCASDEHRKKVRDYKRKNRVKKPRKQKPKKEYADGLTPQQRYRKNNVERVRELARLRYKKNLEKNRRHAQKYWEKNRDVLIEKSRAYRENNIEKCRERERLWSKRNPENARAIAAKRRAREKHAEGSHTAQDIKQMLSDQNFLCNACGADIRNIKWHVDHIIPLALGGSNWPKNLQVLCSECNISKGAKHPDQWKPKKFKCE